MDVNLIEIPGQESKRGYHPQYEYKVIKILSINKDITAASWLVLAGRCRTCRKVWTGI
jgi:prepilin signal peptidase PulO-like enzyme (type II secretory pathway)